MDNILVKQADGVLTITINRPDKQNALTQAMYQAMIEAMTSVEHDDAVKVIILEGAGEHFTSGNDIADFLAANQPIETLSVVKWLRKVDEYTKPIIAKVRGNSVGVGTTVLLHCDLVYCDDTSLFAMPFTQLGLCPEAGASLLLPKLIGHQKASELLLLGKRFGAEEALGFGFINEICPSHELDEIVWDVAQQLCALPPESVGITKSLLKTTPEPVSDRMTREFALFETLLQSDTAKAIFKKFLSK